MTPEQEFEKWYETYDRDGGELMLFNTIDLEAAFLAALAIRRKAEKLLIELGQNQETIILGQPSEQLDAAEPRYELKIIGPERLLKQLLELIERDSFNIRQQIKELP